MANFLQGLELRQLILGRQVEKSSGATAAATTSLFTVSGMVLIRYIVGEVTVAFDGTTTSLNLNFDPTIGSAADICAATVVTSDPVGTIYSYVGAVITTLLVSDGVAVPGTAYAPKPADRFFMPGVIGT